MTIFFNAPSCFTVIYKPDSECYWKRNFDINNISFVDDFQGLLYFNYYDYLQCIHYKGDADSDPKLLGHWRGLWINPATPLLMHVMVRLNIGTVNKLTEFEKLNYKASMIKQGVHGVKE